MKRPVLKAKVSDRDFRDWIAEQSDTLARGGSLPVDGLPG